MSLQIWLPLNNNINNQGLNGIAMAGSPASWGTGKIGKCATFSGSTSNVIYNNTNVLNYTDNFSYCLWINQKYTDVSTDQYAFTVGRADAGGFGYGIMAINPTTIMLWFGTRTLQVNCPSGEWHHIAFTVSGTEIKVYKDGILAKTSTTLTLPTYYDGNGLGIGCFHYSENIYPFYGSINDFRIYDHCLSTAEVKEISKALVVHYKLSDQYETNIRNKYSGDVALGNLINNEFTKTKLADEIGYNYKLSYTGTGNDVWPCMNTGSMFSFTAGKKYFYSCKVRCHSSNFVFLLRASRSVNDWATNVVNVLNADGQWHEYYVCQIINETYDRSGSTVTCNPILEFYSESLATAGKVYSADFDIKDIQVVESDTYVPFIYNAFALSSISDCSGFGNNGEINGTLGFNQNSPRYGGCYKFTGTNYIKTGFSSLMNKLSCSFWVKPNSQDGEYSIIASNYGDPSTGFWISVNCEKSGLWFFNGSYVKSAASSLSNDAWHHACFTYNNGIGKWYIDGNLDSTVDISYRGTSLYISNLTIGNSYTGSFWNTKFYGSISDFRVYSTCLSDDDIYALYHNAASISNNGALMAYEFKEE